MGKRRKDRIGRGEEGRRSDERHETLVDTLHKLEGGREGEVVRCEDGEEVKGEADETEVEWGEGMSAGEGDGENGVGAFWSCEEALICEGSAEEGEGGDGKKDQRGREKRGEKWERDGKGVKAGRRRSESGINGYGVSE